MHNINANNLSLSPLFSGNETPFLIPLRPPVSARFIRSYVCPLSAVVLTKIAPAPRFTTFGGTDRRLPLLKIAQVVRA